MRIMRCALLLILLCSEAPVVLGASLHSKMRMPAIVSPDCLAYVELNGLQLTRLTPIYFASSQVEVVPSEHAKITCIAQVIEVNNLQLALHAHSDAQGRASDNLLLSQQRLVQVLYALYAAGLSEFSVRETKAYGEHFAQRGAKSKQRKVEFIIYADEP